jgi:HEAT repeat protein
VRNCLIEILIDRSQPSYVRQGAATGLVHFDSNQIVETLIAVLADSDSAVRASVAHALGENARYTKGLVDKRAVEPLIRLLMEDSASRARWMAALALQFFDDERALPVLLRLRHISATSIDEKRIKEAAGFVVRNMRRVARRGAATMSMAQRDADVP